MKTSDSPITCSNAIFLLHNFLKGLPFTCKMRPPPLCRGIVLILPNARVPPAVRWFTKKITQEN